jgi:hypothetical protein
MASKYGDWGTKLNNSKIHVFLLEDHALIRTSRDLIRKNKNKRILWIP